MRVTRWLIGSLIVVATATVVGFGFVETRREQAILEQQLIRRAALVADGVEAAVRPLIDERQRENLERLAQRFAGRGDLVGIAVYGEDGEALAVSPDAKLASLVAPSLVHEALVSDWPRETFLLANQHRWHVVARPVHRGAHQVAVVFVVHDAGVIREQVRAIWQAHLIQLLALVLALAATSLVVLHWRLVRPLSVVVAWMKRVRTGEITWPQSLPKVDLFGPLVREVSSMAKSLIAAKATAAEEARLRHARESRWTAERLKEHIRTELRGHSVTVISNREPYMHVKSGRQVRWMVPASGLVTAVEPILRACGGTWVAQGSGDADRETADEQGRLRVPPDSPAYTLRRVWLEKAEEDGYYNGFANEGLWPLCHIAHTRPIFRAEDWEHYKAVNEKFAQAALEELDGVDEPSVLIQDYHFALLPRLIKAKRPDARVALFWHIPWPNPEALGICPWARELLHGMLGADLLGFHIQFHCNNFLDTVDRMLESRIDWEQYAVNRAGHTTVVKPFPISVAVHEPARGAAPVSRETERAEIFKELGMTVEGLGIGVDRIDYTKGIAERFRAIERFLEKYPSFRGRFAFVQLGAPSRTLIKRYHDLGAELDAEANRINRKFQTRSWRPIVFLQKHHSHTEIAPYYRAADLCLVTSLHDGMNLVAKEFVASRTDNRAALVLSQFAGASRELRDALLVNPYDIEQVANAIHYALTMDPEEQRTRMSRMREVVLEHNIYRWAADLVTELARLIPADTSSLSPSISDLPAQLA